MGFMRKNYSGYNENQYPLKGTTMFVMTLFAVIGIAFFAASSVLYFARLFS
jgi:hypothetical protein